MNTPLQILGMGLMIFGSFLITASIIHLIHYRVVPYFNKPSKTKVPEYSDITSKELYSAFKTSFDNHTSLVCYNYFNGPDDWKTWSYETWGRFIYTVNEFLKVENAYWRDTNNLPLNYPEQVVPMWIEFQQRYHFQYQLKNKGL